MIYGYIRVSTDKQTLENQKFEIENFCKKHGFEIGGWIEETISGTKAYNKRALGKLLKKVQSGDFIISSELSRLPFNYNNINRLQVKINQVNVSKTKLEPEIRS